MHGPAEEKPVESDENRKPKVCYSCYILCACLYSHTLRTTLACMIHVCSLVHCDLLGVGVHMYIFHIECFSVSHTWGDTSILDREAVMADTQCCIQPAALAGRYSMAVLCECPVYLRAHCVYTRMCCVVVWGWLLLCLLVREAHCGYTQACTSPIQGTRTPSVHLPWHAQVYLPLHTLCCVSLPSRQARQLILMHSCFAFVYNTRAYIKMQEPQLSSTLRAPALIYLVI